MARVDGIPLSARALRFVLLSLLLLAPARAGAAIYLQAGSGHIIRLGGAAASVFVADPKVAEARPATPDALFVFGVAPGRTTVAALDANGRVLAEQRIDVAPSGYQAAQAQAALRRLVPGTEIRVTQNGSALVLTGSAETAAEAANALAVVGGFVDDPKHVSDEITVREHLQVTLAVRILEMDRNVVRNLGIDWSALGTLGSIGKLPALTSAFNGGTPAVCLAAPIFSIACHGLNLNATINALASDGLARVLAEPNLTVLSGEPASFLAGGEFPIPVGQQNGEVTITFKRYGVQLAFVPTVLADGQINLRVSPEVSELTQQGAVRLTAGNSTISVPALIVRRAETTVELGSGQSFAIAGLLQDDTNRNGSGLPGLRALPVLGALFDSQNFQRNRTELVIIVTPVIVRPVDDPAALRTPEGVGWEQSSEPGPPDSPVGASVDRADTIPVPPSMRPPGMAADAGFIVQ